LIPGLPAGARVTVDTPNDEPLDDPIDPANPGAAVEILDRDPELEALDALAGPGLALVYRCATGDGGRKLVGRVERTRLIQDHELISRQWGGGEYEVDFKNADGTYVKKFVRFAFDEMAYGPAKGPHGGKSGEPQGGGLMLDVMQKQIEAANARAARLNEIVLSALAGRANTAPAPSAPALTFEHVLALAEKFGSRTGAGDDVKAAIAEIKEIAANAGGGDGGIPWGVLISKAVDILPKLMEARPVAARPGAAPGGSPSARAGRPLIPGNGEPPMPNAPDPNIAAVVNASRAHPFYALYVPDIVKAANDEADVDETVATILDAIPTRFDDAVLAVVNRTDVLEYLALFEPEAVSAHREWVQKIVDGIKASYQEDESEPVDDQSPPAAA
jgi:hypothetical protein